MEKSKSVCKDAIVQLDIVIAVVLLILNVIPFVSGIGTMISACIGKEFNVTALIFGILQWLTTFILVGWIWAIYHGILLVKAAKSM